MVCECADYGGVACVSMQAMGLVRESERDGNTQHSAWY